MFLKERHLLPKEETREVLVKKVNMKLGDLLYKGSVKDIFFGENKDTLAFNFSDRYSVFDWGEMPDLLPKKGESLAYMGMLFFEYLEKPETWKNWKAPSHLKSFDIDMLKTLKSEGLKHHAMGLLEGEQSALGVSRVDVPKVPFKEGKYFYDHYKSQVENTLIPLEVIFRFGLPEGSSLVKRLDNEKYRRTLGLLHHPKTGESFSRPLIEFSTKLESSDRYIDYEEAQKIAGLNDFEFSELFSLTVLVACRLRDFFNEVGIQLWDGKFEWAFSESLNGKRGIKLVDSIGPDELRLEAHGEKLSKEFLRGFYRNSSWLKAVGKGKDLAKQRGLEDWKPIVIKELGEKPEPLESSFKKAAESLYLTLANTFSKGMGKEEPFKGAMNLEELCESMKKLKRNIQ